MGYQGAAARTLLFCSSAACPSVCVKPDHAQGAHLESKTQEHTQVLQRSNRSRKSVGLGVGLDKHG